MRLPVFIFLITLANIAYAGQEEWLADFAKHNAGKFLSELSGVPRMVTVRSKPFMGWWLFAEYDQTKGLLKTVTAENVWSEWLYERCKPAGTFTGVSGLGVKAPVKKMNCERVEIQDHDTSGLQLENLELPMTPQQFREIKAKGPIYEIDFEIGTGAEQEVASDNVVIASAKVSNPIEKKIRVLRVYGEIKRLRIFLPDGKTQIGEFSR